MMVIARAVAGFTAIGRRFQFFSERSRPFLPREMTLLGELDRERKGLGLPWLGEHWAARIARQARQLLQADGFGR